jgi:hypothetical protein
MRSWGKIVKAMEWEKMVAPFPSRKTVTPREVELEHVEISARL